MSRIGRQPIVISKDITVEIGKEVVIKKDKQVLKHWIPQHITVKQQDNMLFVERKGNDTKIRALHGLTRKLLYNLITGLQEPFKRVLIIKGIGYKAQVQGKKFILNVGYSHPVELSIPEGITVTVEGKADHVTLSGSNKKLVGEFAAEIRRIRTPEPYKGTGIRYDDERVRRKAGKAGAAAGKK
ncbi:50S ribosomal protein L6 [bacterium]